MKAVTLNSYGSTENLEIVDIDESAPKEDQVKIRLRASAINDWDWIIVMGSPFYIRLLCGLFSPKIEVLGVDFSGEVVEVGNEVTGFNVGDEVYGDLSEYGFGAFAEYVCATEKALTRKPPSMSFQQAAALPHAATLAMQSLQQAGTPKPETRVLINGAGGGVGSLGIQIARAMGIQYVAGVDHSSKLEQMRAQGFDEVYDYTSADFTAQGSQYDLILDTKTNRSPFRYLKALAPGGNYVTVGGTPSRLIQTLLAKPFIRWFTKKQVHIVALKTNQDLDYANQLFEAGKLTPVLEAPYPLEEISAAMEHFGNGLHIGKVMIEV